MATHLDLSGWKLLVDEQRTRDLYASLPPTSCDCGYCRNLSVAFDKLAPVDKSLFDALGIDLTREGGEVYTFTASREDGVSCGGSMIVIGDILESPSVGPEHFPGGEASSPQSPFTDNVSGYFTPEDELVGLYLPEPPDPHFIFQFTMDHVPWVLDEDPSGADEQS